MPLTYNSEPTADHDNRLAGMPDEQRYTMAVEALESFLHEAFACRPQDKVLVDAYYEPRYGARVGEVTISGPAFAGNGTHGNTFFRCEPGCADLLLYCEDYLNCYGNAGELDEITQRLREVIENNHSGQSDTDTVCETGPPAYTTVTVEDCPGRRLIYKGQQLIYAGAEPSAPQLFSAMVLDWVADHVAERGVVDMDAPPRTLDELNAAREAARRESETVQKLRQQVAELSAKLDAAEQQLMTISETNRD